MRARTVFIILLIVILLIGLGPALLAVGSQEVAEAFGCQVDLNRVIPCVIHPAGLVLLGVWAVAALIALIVHWRKTAAKSAKPQPC